jgi:hypothetical protein
VAVERGDITFVPLADTGGPGGGAEIFDGKYRVIGRGGLWPGKYRVMVNAFSKTGRKVSQSNGFEKGLVDETRRLGPVAYSSADSPLVVTIADRSSNSVDIELPAK